MKSQELELHSISLRNFGRIQSILSRLIFGLLESFCMSYAVWTIHSQQLKWRNWRKKFWMIKYKSIRIMYQMSMYLYLKKCLKKILLKDHVLRRLFIAIYFNQKHNRIKLLFLYNLINKNFNINLVLDNLDNYRMNWLINRKSLQVFICPLILQNLIKTKLLQIWWILVNNRRKI